MHILPTNITVCYGTYLPKEDNQTMRAPNFNHAKEHTTLCAPKCGLNVCLAIMKKSNNTTVHMTILIVTSMYVNFP